jgi:hypothetical protein
MPLPIIDSTTATARAVDRTQLLRKVRVLIGTLSVWPATRNRRSLNSTRTAVTAARACSPAGDSLSEPDGNKIDDGSFTTIWPLRNPDLELAAVDQGAELLLQLAVGGPGVAPGRRADGAAPRARPPSPPSRRGSAPAPLPWSGSWPRARRARARREALRSRMRASSAARARCLSDRSPSSLAMWARALSWVDWRTRQPGAGGQPGDDDGGAELHGPVCSAAGVERRRVNRRQRSAGPCIVSLDTLRAPA